jgi:hypothetical protein
MALLPRVLRRLPAPHLHRRKARGHRLVVLHIFDVGLNVGGCCANGSDKAEPDRVSGDCEHDRNRWVAAQAARAEATIACCGDDGHLTTNQLRRQRRGSY